MCGWIGNGILARAPIRPNSAWKALGVIGPSRSVMKTCEDAPPRRCLSARLAQRCGSPNPLRTAPGSETARATTSRTDLCVASSTREARQSAINWSRSNIILIRQCVWIAQFVRGAAAKSSGALPTPPVLLPNDSTYETAALRDCSPVNVRFGSFASYRHARDPLAMSALLRKRTSVPCRNCTKKPLKIVLPKSQQNASFCTPNLAYGKQTVFDYGCGTLSGSKMGEVFR